MKEGGAEGRKKEGRKDGRKEGRDYAVQYGVAVLNSNLLVSKVPFTELISYRTEIAYTDPVLTDLFLLF